MRIAELLLGLTGVADLGMGQPVGSAARTCHVAVILARTLGCDEQAVSDVFYAAFLQHVGCTAYSHEASLLFGDEVSVKRAVRQRAGRFLDPEVARAFVGAAPRMLAASTSETVLDLEPRPIKIDAGSALDNVLRAFGEAVDLKAPFLHGHSTQVADLTFAAAACLRLSETETVDARRAAYVHNLGRAAVPSAIWECAGDLSRDAWSQVHLHTYHSEQILHPVTTACSHSQVGRPAS